MVSSLPCMLTRGLDYPHLAPRASRWQKRAWRGSGVHQLMQSAAGAAHPAELCHTGSRNTCTNT